MSKKLKVALIYGGPSAEYEVSLKSAAAVRENIDRSKYVVIDVHITKDEAWVIDGNKLSTEAALTSLGDVAVAFLAVHGTFGEDGKLQKLLSDNDILFTGSGAAASALAMDKIRCSNIFEKAGLRIPKTVSVITAEQAKKASQSFKVPFVVKPVSQGSSVGVSIVHDLAKLDAAIELGFQHDSQIIIQEFIAGQEISCGVLEGVDGKITALPPTELIPVHADFFDYDAKYTPGATKEITPPEVSESMITKIQDIAIESHQLLGCQGYSRTDVIVRDDEIFVIESNTLPGMTETSIFPQQAVAAGMTFVELIDQIIATALARQKKV